MLKRIIPLVAILAIIASIFAFPVSADDRVENGMTIVDYNDYVSNVQVDGDNDIVTVTLPPYMYGYIQKDHNGQYMTDGVPLGSLYCFPDDNLTDYASVYYPGSGITKTYLDLANIPDGSSFSTKGKVWIEPNLNGKLDASVDVQYYCCIEYFNSNFVSVGSQRTQIKGVSYNLGAHVYELPFDGIIEKPENASYCVTFFQFRVVNIDNDGSPIRVWFDFDRPSLKMSISSLYRLQEQSGKTNELLDKIVNGEVTPEAPEGSGSVGDLDDVEGALKDDTSAGREEAEQIFNESWGLVVAHTAGFLFLSDVIERMIGVGWMRGILTVSLSLGIFAFLVNIAITTGNKLSSKGGKSGKGGKP